ncbi:MAG: ABC transporter permease [Aliidongia sp.]
MAEFPEIESAARLTSDRAGVRHGLVEASEGIYWADPGLLTVLGLKTIAGDAATALDTPDSVVLTRSMARKYFGTDAPLGATLELNRKTPMRVTAVIEDLPSNTHLDVQIIASGKVSYSRLSEEDAEVQKLGSTTFSGYLYLRLKPGVSPEALEQRLPEFVEKHFPPDPDDGGGKAKMVFKLDPVTKLHLLPYWRDMKEGSSPATLTAIGIIGVLIIAIASINFVNLMTARAARRAIEVGVRKALGATRRQLMVQFMGEAVGFCRFRGIAGDRRHRTGAAQLQCDARSADRLRLLAGSGAGPRRARAGAVGRHRRRAVSGAGAVPLQPGYVLKTARALAAGGGKLRQGLVVLQFSVSIGLAVATLVIHWQTDFATGQSLRFDKDQVLLVRGPQACAESFRNEVSSVLGVGGTVCSRAAPLDFSSSDSTSTLADGRAVDVDVIDVDYGFFDFYGLKLLAGRSFDRSRSEDAVPPSKDAPMTASVIINEAAMRAYGFANPAAALGQTVTLSGIRPAARPSQIIGVVPDFPIGTIREAVQPSVFFVDQTQWGLLGIKLDGAAHPRDAGHD